MPVTPRDRGTRRRAAIFAVACAALAAPGRAQEAAPRTAGPSFRTLSRVTYAESPGEHHTLEAHFVGADRARLLLRFVEGRASNRVVNYRLGERLYVLRPAPDAATGADAQPSSVAPEGADRDALLRSLELRRALFAWPADLAWRSGDGGDADGAELVAPLGSAGSLVAHLGEGGLPRRIAALDPEGAVHEACVDVAWTERGGRHWPARFGLTWAGRPVWDEEVVETVSGVSFVDLFFLPRDRREERAPFREGAAGLEHTDRLASWRKQVDLRARDDWEAAWREAAALARSEHAALRERGLDRAPVPSLVLGAGGQPEAVRLELPLEAAPPPDPERPGAWTRSEGGPAIRVGAPGLGAAAGQLRRVLGAVPEGARVADAVVRRLRPAGDLALLVVGLEAQDG